MLEELLDLLKFLDRLIQSGDVLEGDLRGVLGDLAGLGLAKLHHPVSRPLHLHEDEDHEPDEEQPGEEVDQDVEQTGRLGIGLEFDIAGSASCVDQLVLVSSG